MKSFGKPEYKLWMVKSFKEIHHLDRPREKLQSKGAQSLSNLELMAALLGSGSKKNDVYELSRSLLKLLENKDQDSLQLSTLLSLKGVGVAKASQVVAAFELAKRFLVHQKVKVQTAQDVALLTEDLKNKKQEYFVTLTLDGANCLIEKRTVFIGTLTESLIHPREVFADAVHDRAASLILVHNHPSGYLMPSEEDLNITKRLVAAGDLMGIPVLDHIIISHTGYYSFRDEYAFDFD